MADMVIFIRGGVFQGAISDSANNRIMVVDYDDEESASHRQRHFQAIPLKADTFARVVDGNDESD